jgi:hypothetical protein
MNDPTTEGLVTEGGRRHGWVSLYAAAFALMLAAGAVLVVTSLGSLQSTRLLWVSAGLSITAIVVSIASLVVPRR